MREHVRNLKIKSEILGYNISADSLIIISPYVIHRKPNYWSDPESFNPARFLEPSKWFKQSILIVVSYFGQCRHLYDCTEIYVSSIVEDLQFFF